MAVTLKDIAKKVGVGESTVSRVLNNSPNPIRISDITRQKILKVAREWGYQPNAAARALSTQRAGQIGFILSDTVTGGWSNAYFAQRFAGVEQACRARGYGLLASLYNLTNIDTFVIPKKVGQRNVDGVVLTGFVQAEVVRQFRKFKIPCVCVNQNVEAEQIIATVGSDLVGGRFQAIEYAVELGHSRILYDAGFHPQTKEEGDTLVQRVREAYDVSKCQVSILDLPGNKSDYSLAEPLMKYWFDLPASQRPTVIMGSDQTLYALLKEITHHGLRCPDDISLISNCDTHLCEFANPALTAVREDSLRLGHEAANLLIDCIENNDTLSPAMSRNDFPCKLMVRESCAQVSRLHRELEVQVGFKSYQRQELRYLPRHR